jgi:hypothetical protein
MSNSKFGRFWMSSEELSAKLEAPLSAFAVKR